MKTNRAWIFVAAVVGCMWSLVLAGCGAGAVGDETPAGWKTFDSDLVSLSLPNGFEGGEVAGSAEEAAKIEEAAATDPSLSVWGRLTGVDVPLLMFGEPDQAGKRPMVLAMREYCPPKALLEEHIEITGPHGVPDTETRVESLTESEARVTVVYSDVPDGEWTAQTYWVVKRSGSYILSVFYSADSEIFVDMEPIFRQSAETIVLKGP